MLGTDDVRVEHAAGGVEGIDGGVDTKLSNGTRKHSGSIQMGEGGGRGGISQIIGRDIDGLDRGNGTLGGGGNTLLETTEIGGEGGLVTDSGGNTTEKGRHLRVGLGEAENVVDEKEHILALNITEVLGNGKTGKSDTGTSTRGLVHLTVDEGALGVATLGTKLDDTRLNHLTVEIVTLTGALTDTGEDGETTVGLGDVVNELHDEHSLSDTGTTEETNLTTTLVGGKEIDDLDASDKNLLLSGLLSELGSLTMDGPNIGSINGTLLIDGLTNDVHDTTKGTTANGDLNGGASVNDLLAADKTVSGVHSNAADSVVTHMLGNLENEANTVALNLKGGKDRGELTIEANIDDGANNLADITGINSGGGLSSESTSNVQASTLALNNILSQAGCVT
mmetsp:Transcript_8345/g.16061  ORF Transcript_8345/g.16061 Transcript_8345/m.16061 type:complete len:394 (+) Transcript_8345:943-2124(+)